MIYTLAGMASGPSLRRRSAGQATLSGRSSPPGGAAADQGRLGESARQTGPRSARSDAGKRAGGAGPRQERRTRWGQDLPLAARQVDLPGSAERHPVAGQARRTCLVQPLHQAGRCGRGPPRRQGERAEPARHPKGGRHDRDRAHLRVRPLPAARGGPKPRAPDRNLVLSACELALLVNDAVNVLPCSTWSYLKGTVHNLRCLPGPR
jgi:hypothetical protein